MIFAKRVRIAMNLQDNAYAAENYQAWRDRIVNVCHEQVVRLNDELICVKLKKRYVEKYREITEYVCLGDTQKGELTEFIAPIVYMPDNDEMAKRFDNFMYGLIIAQMEALPGFKHAKKNLCDIALSLEKMVSIPQVKDKLPLIKTISTDEFWAANDILLFERAREELRDLIKFLIGNPPKIIFTNLTDPVVSIQEGVALDPAYDFEDYRVKVSRYVAEHANALAIHKLTHNIPLTAMDYKELERVLTSELGSKEDYQREYGETPFGLLVRKIAKLDHQAAMDAFSSFINDQSLNQSQIAFVHKVVNHIEQNGYMDDVKELLQPPFDKPLGFIKLFDAKRQRELAQMILKVKQNAQSITA